MEEYGGYALERTIAQDMPLRAQGCVLSVRERAGGGEVFRVAAWVTHRLGRRSTTGQGTTELAVMFAEQWVRDLVDGAGFEPGSSYREVHAFDPLLARETVARDRVRGDADPEPPLPVAWG